MAHLNYIRNIDHRRRANLSDIIEPIFRSNSFAALYGIPVQRNSLGLHGMARCCGEKGIILLHDNPSLENRLSELYTISPNLQREHPDFRIYLANQNGGSNSFYDPLYGLTQPEVLNSILLWDSSSHSDTRAALRTYLQAYLEIMEFQFRATPAPFGHSPYNLDLLLDLTAMPYDVLQESVLNYLPSAIANSINGRLSTPNAQQSAFNAVNAFAGNLQTTLWTRKGFSGHSRLNIVQAAADKNLISIYAPSSDSVILDYLAAELQHLKNAKIPFLLVVSEVDLNSSSNMKNFFLHSHEDLNYSTGILSASASTVTSSSEEIVSLLEQHQETTIFSCTTTTAAAPFSDAFGAYLRKDLTTNRNSHLGLPPHMSFGHGSAVHRVKENTVTADEFASLGDGCILTGSKHLFPVLVDSVII